MTVWSRIKPRIQADTPTAATALVFGSAAGLVALRYGGSLCSFAWPIVLDFVRAFLSWPPIVLLLVAYLARKFEGNIRAMIDRVRAIKFAGAEASLEEQRLEGGKGPQLGLPGLSELPAGEHPTLPGIADVQGTAHGAVNRRYDPEIFAHVPVPPDADIEAAITWVAANPGPTLQEYVYLQFRFNCERVLNVIFGTQVQCVEYLANDPRPHPLTDLLPLFNKHVELGGKPDQVLAWAGFLVSQGLVANVGSPEGPLYQVTEVGRRFLAYIKQHYPFRWNTGPL